MKPPIAAKKPKRIRRHGDVRVDPYAWLRDRDDPEVLAYLKAENRHTAQRMRGTQPLQKKLFEEMRRRIKETDLDVPVQVDDYFYYSRTIKGQQSPIFCRRRGSLRAREQVILDHNELARGKKFFDVGLHAMSPDHRLLAYSSDTRGNERYTLRIKDLTTGKLRREAIEDVDSVAWALDGETFFYTVLAHLHRRRCVLRRGGGASVAGE